jgi:hypothetical protein
VVGKPPGAISAVDRRLAKKLKLSTQALGFLKHALPGVDLAAIPITGVLRAFRAAWPSPVHPALRAEVLAHLTRALAKAFDSMIIKPADLGLPDSQTLARAFMAMLERTAYATYTVKRLRGVAGGVISRTPGLRSVFAGEFFELLVRNLTDLQAEFRSMAEELRHEMDGILNGHLTGRPQLLDGDGKEINVKGTFGPVRKLVDIVELVPNAQPLKFIDFMYVAEFIPDDGSPARLAVLLESEFKLPGAARELRKQVGKALARLATGQGIAGIFDDTKAVASFDRKNLMFSQTAMTRTAVSPGPTPAARWVITDKGGYQESYLHLKVDIDVDELYRVVNLLFSMTK